MITELKTPSERVRQIRMMAGGLSRREFAQKYNVNVHTLQSWELGKNNISAKTAEKIVRVAEKAGITINPDWLVKGTGDLPSFSSHKEKEMIVNQSNKNFWHERFAILKEFAVFKENNPNAAIVQIYNNGMMPFYSIYDYVGGQIVFSDFHLFDGQNCIVYIKDKLAHVRKLVWINSSSYNLAYTNPLIYENPVLFNVKIEYLCPITWHRKICQKEKNCNSKNR